ncbi:unnamed protein product [Protopolystoma xenopodis]|uniref:Uncharacterized protein n=1 Tax=Protopolystoma xenopodis TaxID=117903 RepID=A0A3S4ZI17_9PLAT|nr:unnamed protein product [Protopolystoma xenopodis]
MSCLDVLASHHGHSVVLSETGSFAYWTGEMGSGARGECPVHSLQALRRSALSRLHRAYTTQFSDCIAIGGFFSSLPQPFSPPPTTS